MKIEALQEILHNVNLSNIKGGKIPPLDVHSEWHIVH